MKFISWTVSPCFRAGGISSSSSFAHWWWQTVVFLGSASETNHGPMSYGGWAPWSKSTAGPLTGRWTSRWPLANISDRSLAVHQCNKPLPKVCQGVWGDWGEASLLGKYRGVAVCNLTGECCENCLKIGCPDHSRPMFCCFASPRHHSSSLFTLKRQMPLSQLRVLTAANV